MTAFTEKPVVRILDRYQYRIEKPYTFYHRFIGSTDVITVPVGYVTDLASVPRGLWWWFPPNGRWAGAAILHDYLYGGGEMGGESVTRKEADEIFHEAMLILGVGKWKAKVMWFFVRCFGWRAWRKRGLNVINTGRLVR